MEYLKKIWRSFSNKSISSKLLSLSVFIGLMFLLVAVAMIFYLQVIEKELRESFLHKVGDVADNAQIGRELGNVLSETTLLVSTFHENTDILETGGKKILHGIRNLKKRSKDVQLIQSLDEFEIAIQTVIEQCRAVIHAQQEIQNIHRVLYHTVTQMDEVISSKIVDSIMAGKDGSLLERMPVTISGYFDALNRIELQFLELGLRHFEQPFMEQEHPVLTLLDDFALSIRPLTGYEFDIAQHGLQISTEIKNYRGFIIHFYDVVGELNEKLKNMNRQKDRLLVMMREVDTHIESSAKEGTHILAQQIIRVMTFGLIIIFLATLFVVFLSYSMGQSVLTSVKQVIRGLEKASEELVLDNLLEKMLTTVLEHSSAERCVLLVPKHGKWTIEAEAFMSEDSNYVFTAGSNTSYPMIPDNFLSYLMKSYGKKRLFIFMVPQTRGNLVAIL